MGTDRANVLTPYVPRLVVDWLRDTPALARRSIPGTVAFADISGFTQLTELLARRGKVGAEEMGDILNAVFEDLLGSAYPYHAGLVKWGGDAVLLLFEGDDHAERACAAAVGMQRVMRTVGRLKTSAGGVRLRMSIGIHTGHLDFLLVGHRYRELIVTGPAATTVALMEKAAEAGDIVISTATAAVATAAGAKIDEAKGPGWLLAKPPPGVVPRPIRSVALSADVDLATALPASLLEHLLGGAVESEHRHVAVGFVEFSGADALAQLDDADELTRAVEHLVGSCQDAADTNAVTILSTDVNPDGGKVIFISGAPRRVGDDEARVLTAVRTVLDRAGVLRLRAGVTSGRVIAGDFGPPYRRNYSVAGDCVNLAARLMGASEPGQLLATEAVLDQAGGRFHTTPVPPFVVKGKRDPVRALSVEGTRSSRIDGLPSAIPLIGRDRELGVLLDALRDVHAGTGRVVDLIGPPGIGKSRLLEELAAVSGCPMLWVDGDIYGEAIPYLPIREFVRAQLGLRASDTRATVAAAFEDLVTSQAPSMLPWLPLVGRVVDADFPMTPVVADIDVVARKDRMEWAISELLGAMITEPTILVFNDAHFMDDATVDLLRRLNADAPGRPWLTVTSYRADERAQVSAATTVIELAPLDGEAAETLLATMTKSSPLPAHRLDALAQRANGNPLFLRELAAGALDGEPGFELPDSIEGILSARIDRLNPPRRRTLRAAAVLGMVVDLNLFAAVLRTDGALDLSSLDDLRQLDEFVAEVDPGRLQFRHHLMREAAYEGLPYRRRAELHAHTAAAIEEEAGADRDDRADLLSLHCFHGARYDDAWRYAVLAGDRARAQYANSEAADCYRRALDAAGRLGRAAEIEIGPVAEALGDVCLQLGEFDAAECGLRQAHALPGLAPETLARLRLKISFVRETIAQYPAALRWLTKGRETVVGHTSREAELVMGRLTIAYARIRYTQGRHQEARRWATKALHQAESVRDDETIALALEYLDLTDLALGNVGGEPRSTRSMEIYEAAGDLCGQGRIHNSLGMRAYFLGRWPEALHHYSSSAAAFSRAGRDWAASVSQANVAEVLSDQGHLLEAREVLEASLRVWRGIHADTEIAFGTYQLGRIAARSGEVDVAFDRYTEARTFCNKAGEVGEVLLIDSYIAECHGLAGRPERALDLADDSLVRAVAMTGLIASVPLLHRVRAHALLALGRSGEAATAMRESLVTARQRDALHDVALALDGLRAIGAADEADAEAWRTECDELRTRLGMVPQDHPETSPAVALSR